ncbi:MAG: hypothetical protein ACHQ9S_22590 [Candidatus Binatia bacterium]
MKALQFRMSVPRIVLARALGALSRNAFTSPIGPVQLEEIPDAQVRGDRWVVLRPALTGVCGSDQKQVLAAIAKTTGCVKVAITFADAPRA